MNHPESNDKNAQPNSPDAPAAGSGAASARRRGAWRKPVWIALTVCVAGIAIALPVTLRKARSKRASKTAKSTPKPQRAPGSVDFATSVQPIFADNCVKCHGPEKQKGGFRLDQRQAALGPSESGEPAIVPGDVANSGLLRRITTEDSDERMPPKGERLTAAQVTLLRKWIGEGADWPETGGAAATAAVASRKITAKERDHWSFRPLQHPAPPAVADQSWAQTPIDRFILAALENKGLRPNGPASKRVLIRRLSFDLIGLPPSPEETEAFEKDPSPEAYERLVDRLLANPHYGERWGRHWLDAARYADSAGYEEDRPRPDAYHYRDFVIRAFNEDLPYDRFLQLQLAGDLLEPQSLEAKAATGFIAAAPDVRPDFINFRKKDRSDELDDVVSTTGVAMLGLTVGCARCHDHKFDPISEADYYRLTAFFTGTERIDESLDAKRRAEYDRAHTDFAKRLKAVEKKLKSWTEEASEKVRGQKIAGLPITDAEKALLRAPEDAKNHQQRTLLARFKDELDVNSGVLRASLDKKELETWDGLKKAVDDVQAAEPAEDERELVVHDGAPQKTFLLSRGDPEHPGPEVTPGVLSILSPDDAAAPNGETRANLARWMTDPAHGAGALAARVAVNRLWQHHFGRGLVATPGDFGVRGDLPTHPELLEWLASEFIRSGWKVKALQKMIVMSAVYRQGVESDPERLAADPEDHLWWRRTPSRVEAEVLRDSILSVSGNLNLQMYGPAVKPHMAPEAISITNPAKNYDQWPDHVVDGPQTWRRSVYVFIKRANLFPFLQAFDAPIAIGSCTRRNPTTVAPQALALLNDEFVCEQARHFAERVSAAAPAPDERIRLAFALALDRSPTPREVDSSRRFVEAQEREYQSGAEKPELAALADFCQALLASNEFSYID